MFKLIYTAKSKFVHFCQLNWKANLICRPYMTYALLNRVKYFSWYLLFNHRLNPLVSIHVISQTFFVQPSVSNRPGADLGTSHTASSGTLSSPIRPRSSAPPSCCCPPSPHMPIGWLFSSPRQPFYWSSSVSPYSVAASRVGLGACCISMHDLKNMYTYTYTYICTYTCTYRYKYT